MIDPAKMGAETVTVGSGEPAMTQAEAESQKDAFREALGRPGQSEEEGEIPETQSFTGWTPEKGEFSETQGLSGRMEAKGELREGLPERRAPAGGAGEPVLKGDPEDGPEDGDDLRGAAAPPPPPFSGDALLRSLGAVAAPRNVQESGPAGEASASALAADLAERILVGADDKNPEIRIALKASVLPDTEIILRQEGGGRLTVCLTSGDPGSLEALRQAQGDLEKKIQALGRDCAVETRDSREDGREDRRSRGLDYFTGDKEGR